MLLHNIFYCYINLLYFRREKEIEKQETKVEEETQRRAAQGGGSAAAGKEGHCNRVCHIHI